MGREDKRVVLALASVFLALPSFAWLSPVIQELTEGNEEVERKRKR